MLDELVRTISTDSGMAEEAVMERIADKKRELGGLISEEGAAYMVAKEMGLSLLRKQERLHIQNIIPGMKNVDIVGKVVRISPVREFKTEKASGKVMNVMLADSTGSVRLTLWNEEIAHAEGLREGDAVQVRGFAREDNMGGAELRIGRFGTLHRSEEQIPDIAPSRRQGERGTVAELREGQYREVRGCVVQIFESSVFFEKCPECGSRLKEDNNYACPDHGARDPVYGMVLTGILDDGTDSTRIVLFGEQAEKLIGMTTKDAKTLFDRKKTVRAVLDRVPLGKEFLFEGRVRRNELFDRIEFIVSGVKDVHVRKEIELLL